MENVKMNLEQEPYRQADEKQLEELRQLINDDARELLDHILHGGTVGVYLSKGLPFYFISDALLHEMELTREQFKEKYQGRFLETIHPNEREEYMKDLMEAMNQGRLFEKVCRVSVGISYCYMRDIGKYIQMDSGMSFVLLMRCNVTDVKVYQQELEQKAAIYEEKAKELETLATNIPGGFCITNVNEGYILSYGNDRFYAQLGYTKEQLNSEKKNNIASVIYEKDLESVNQIIREIIDKKEIDAQLEHRIVQRNGNIIWCLVKGQFSYEKEMPELRCLVMDITNRKKIELDAKISEERFRIALAQTDNTIFEYNIQSRVMIHGDRSAESYGLKQYTENVPESLLEQGVVHPDSANDFLGMYEEIRTGSKNASCLLLARLNTGEYVWRKMMMTAIFDENGRPVQAVGVLEDVDEQVRREAELRLQMEKDILTGLYSRGAVITKIKQVLGVRTKGTFQALAVIDIDDFKGVNDHYGHMFGDYVLSQSAERIIEILQKDGFAGRIGGDEFVVFFQNLSSREEAKSWGERIVNCFSGNFCDRGKVAAVTGSVGVAVAPMDGKSFEDLYQNADLALYEAKRMGKNTVIVYHQVQSIASNR